MIHGLHCSPVTWSLPALVITSGTSALWMKSRTAPATADEMMPTTTSTRSRSTSFLIWASPVLGFASLSAYTSSISRPATSRPNSSKPSSSASVWSLPSPAYTPEDGSSTPTLIGAATASAAQQHNAAQAIASALAVLLMKNHLR